VRRAPPLEPDWPAPRSVLREFLRSPINPRIEKPLENHLEFLRAGRIGRGFVCLSFLCLTLTAQVSLVHVTTCGPGPFPATTCTIPASANGHLIVVAWASAWGTTPVVTGVTDNAQNKYAEAGNARSADSANDMVDIWFAKNSAAGATTLTITPNPGANQGAAVIWEFANVDTISPVDQTSVLNSQPATTSPSSAPVTTTLAGDLVIAVATPAAPISGIYPGNPFTNDSLSYGVGWAHLITSTAGTYAAEWTTGSGTYASSTVAFKLAGSSGLSPCDLNDNGVVNFADAQLAVGMSLGSPACTANVFGPGVCNAVVVQRVVNASMGGVCLVGETHTVSLNWTASTSPNVAGYNLYRGTVSGGPYGTKLNSSPVAATTYTDTSVTSGLTYYYVTTAVDNSGNESSYSNQAQAVIPDP
jgi:hypothetical protein